MARNHHTTIPVYSAVDSSKIIRRVTFRQAKEMLEKQEASGIKSARKNGKGGDIVALQLREMMRDDGNSPCTITSTEMRANAGEFTSDRTPAWAKEAISKIEIWPFVGDDKAVRVTPRHQ